MTENKNNIIWVFEEEEEELHMEKDFRKGTKIIKIFGDENIKLKNYVVFEDRWISKHDKFLLDENNNKYIVLDYKIIRDYSVYGVRKYSCVKLNKTFYKNFKL